VDLASLPNYYFPFDSKYEYVLQLDFSSLKGKVVLVENTATLWGTTVRDFTQLNQLQEKFGEKLVGIKKM